MPDPTPRDHASALASVVEALRACPAVIAIGAYGSTAGARWSPDSDIDLVAVLDHEPPMESIRLRVAGVPVDLNLRSAGEGEHGIRGAQFMPLSEPLWDPDGVLARARTTSRQPNVAETRMLRYLLAHLLDKARQLERTPPLGRLFASGESVNIVRGYYHARGRPLLGPLPALHGLLEEAPDLVAALDGIRTGPEPPSVYFERACEIALAPVGGLWRDHEAFVVGWQPNERDEEGERWARETLGTVLEAGGERRGLV